MSTREHPYTAAFDSGDQVHVSGALSVDEFGQVTIGRLDAMMSALATLERRLATVGLGLEHVVSTTYYVTDITLRDEANEHFFEAFAEPRPARTFVEVSALPYGCTVEISAVAAHRPVRPVVPVAGR